MLLFRFRVASASNEAFTETTGVVTADVKVPWFAQPFLQALKMVGCPVRLARCLRSAEAGSGSRSRHGWPVTCLRRSARHLSWTPLPFAGRYRSRQLTADLCERAGC